MIPTDLGSNGRPPLARKRGVAPKARPAFSGIGGASDLHASDVVAEVSSAAVLASEVQDLSVVYADRSDFAGRLSKNCDHLFRDRSRSGARRSVLGVRNLFRGSKVHDLRKRVVRTLRDDSDVLLSNPQQHKGPPPSINTSPGTQASHISTPQFPSVSQQGPQSNLLSSSHIKQAFDTVLRPHFQPEAHQPAWSRPMPIPAASGVGDLEILDPRLPDDGVEAEEAAAEKLAEEQARAARAASLEGFAATQEGGSGAREEDQHSYERACAEDMGADWGGSDGEDR